jgi:hypothetical protein
MTDSVAKTAAPPHAIRVWSNGLVLFAEIPGDPPYVMNLALTEAGLTKCLSLLRERAKDYPRASSAVSERVITRASNVQCTDSQRKSALEILKRVGML